jgi:3-dehydroquinate synthase
MGLFRVNLKKVVDDSYDIEIGYEMFEKLIEDIRGGLVGDIRKFVVITDSTVEDLYPLTYKVGLGDAFFIKFK